MFDSCLHAVVRSSSTAIVIAATVSDDYNIRLSQRRAASVAAVARSVGAPVEREIGYGERQPIATNSTAAGMQQNRRVEIVCYRW